MPSYLHLAYRRNARAAAKKYKVKQSDNQEAVKKAREDLVSFVNMLLINHQPPTIRIGTDTL